MTIIRITISIDLVLSLYTLEKIIYADRKLIEKKNLIMIGLDHDRSDHDPF